MITDYASLIQSVKNWTDDDPGDLIIEDMIDMVEARLNRMIRHPDMEVSTTITVDAETEALPSGFLELKSNQLQGTTPSVLQYIPPAKMEEAFPDSSQTGRPEFFTIQAGNFKFGPPPDSSRSWDIVYFQRIPALTSSNTTNWLINNHPDVYLWGCLAHAQNYFRDDQDAAKNKFLFEESVEEVRRNAVRHRVSQPLVMRAAVSE